MVKFGTRVLLGYSIKSFGWICQKRVHVLRQESRLAKHIGKTLRHKLYFLLLKQLKIRNTCYSLFEMHWKAYPTSKLVIAVCRVRHFILTARILPPWSAPGAVLVSRVLRKQHRGSNAYVSAGTERKVKPNHSRTNILTLIQNFINTKRLTYPLF